VNVFNYLHFGIGITMRNVEVAANSQWHCTNKWGSSNSVKPILWGGYR